MRQRNILILRGLVDKWLKYKLDFDWWHKHSDRVGRLAQIFAPFVNLDAEIAYMAGLCHDLGKADKRLAHILIRARGRKLTPEEWNKVRLHPSHSHDQLIFWQEYYGFKIDQFILLAAKYHHVWFNQQQGYPLDQESMDFFNDLSQENKTQVAMIGLVDTIDAMFCRIFTQDPDRIYDAYVNYMSIDEVLAEINEVTMGSQHDPKIIQLFNKNLEQVTQIYTGAL